MNQERSPGRMRWEVLADTAPDGDFEERMALVPLSRAVSAEAQVQSLTEALAGLTEAAGEAVELLQRTAVGQNTTSTLTAITLGLKHPLKLARAALPVPVEGEADR